MKAQQIELHVEQTREGFATVRTIHLKVPGKARQSIYFRCENETLPEPRVLDGFVIGILLYAMESHMDLRVHGSLTQRLLQNMEEYQGAWHSWEPDRYHVVNIIPDDVVGSMENKTTRGAIAAFSGGIDSTFTLWRQQAKTAGAGQYAVRDALLIHGFDVKIRNGEQFTLLADRLAKFLESWGIRLRVIRSNLKELDLMQWEHSFSAQMAACLNQYSHEFRYALLAGSEPYNALILPGGSNPIIDPLLSGEDMTLVHDAAGFTRPQKLERLVSEGVPLRHLKVCWEGLQQDQNCGRCEKCIRTHLSFLCAGVSHAPCFAEPLRMSDLKSMLLISNVQHGQLNAVYNHIRACGLENEDWAVALKTLLDRFHPPNAAQTLSIKIRKKIRRIVAGY